MDADRKAAQSLELLGLPRGEVGILRVNLPSR